MLQSNMLREENAALRDQCAEYQSQGCALQDEAAEHMRTISAANAQLKLLQSKVGKLVKMKSNVFMKRKDYTFWRPYICDIPGCPIGRLPVAVYPAPTNPTAIYKPSLSGQTATRPYMHR